MDMKEKAGLRAGAYGVVEAAVAKMAGVLTVEPSVKGLLVAMDSGEFLEVTVVVKDSTKFDVEAYRAEYTEKVTRAAERAEKARVAAAEKAAKALAKAAKATETA